MQQHKNSNSLNILNAEPLGYSPEAHAMLAQLGEVAAKEMSRSQLLKELDHYDVLIVRLAHQIDRDVIDAGRRLRVIVTATTGLDHIDVEYAQKRGITVLSLRGETVFLREIRATAEHTWTLLLGLVRKIVPASIAAVLVNGIVMRFAEMNYTANDWELLVWDVWEKKLLAMARHLGWKLGHLIPLSKDG